MPMKQLSRCFLSSAQDLFLSNIGIVFVIPKLPHNLLPGLWTYIITNTLSTHTVLLQKLKKCLQVIFCEKQETAGFPYWALSTVES